MLKEGWLTNQQSTGAPNRYRSLVRSADHDSQDKNFDDSVDRFAKTPDSLGGGGGGGGVVWRGLFN